MDLRRYTIEYSEDEGECDECGWSLIVGDDAFDVDDGFAICCTRTCARRHLRRAARDAVRFAPPATASTNAPQAAAEEHVSTPRVAPGRPS